MAVLAALLILVRPASPSVPGTALLVLSSSGGDVLRPTDVQIGSRRLTLGGQVPKAPEVRTAARLSLVSVGLAVAFLLAAEYAGRRLRARIGR